MNELPRVSVLITAHNEAAYLKEAVDSCLAQDYPNLEVLVVDDGSVPRMDDIVGDLRGSRVKYLYQEHEGFPHGLIRGMEEASGEYVAILDHDDMLTPNSVESRVKAIQETDAPFVYGNTQFVRSDGFEIYIRKEPMFAGKDWFQYCVLMMIPVINHTSTMFRRESVMKLGNYDKCLGQAFDHDLLLRLVEEGDPIQITPVVAKKRIHTKNASKQISYRLGQVFTRFELIRNRAPHEGAALRLGLEYAMTRPVRVLNRTAQICKIKNIGPSATAPPHFTWDEYLRAQSIKD